MTTNRGIKAFLVAAALSAAALAPLPAQGPGQGSANGLPPAMFDESGDNARPLDIARVEIEASVLGYAARTRMTLTFSNPGNGAVAGNLYFPLPAGASVSGYALDVGGAMVDGVVVEKVQGRQVYRTVMARGIDPGIVEWTKGNVFKTRVFPVPARGTRTVRIEYVCPIDADAKGAVYSIPLGFKKKLPYFRLSVEVLDTRSKPEITETDIPAFRFASWKSGYRAEVEVKDAALSRGVSIRLPPVASDPVSVDRGRDGKTYAAWYGLRSQLVSRLKAPASSGAPSRIALYWDASLSGEKDGHRGALDVLKAYFDRFPDSSVDVSLVVFRDAPEDARNFSVKDGKSGELLRFLSDIPYDGATRLQGLPAAAKGSAFAILVSDGLATLGSPSFGPGVPLFALASGQEFDAARLSALAAMTGGALIRSDGSDAAAAAARIGTASFRFLGAAVKEGKASGFTPAASASLSGSGDLVGIIGAMEGKAAKAELRFGYDEKNSFTVPVAFEDTGVTSDSAPPGSSQSRAILETLWGQSELARMLSLPDADSAETMEAVEALGRAYNLVTPRTSMIVLEGLEQYVEFGIRPPESLPAMRAEWAVRVAQIRKDEEAARKATMDRLVSLWDARVAWWNRAFSYPPDFRYQEPKKKSAENARSGQLRMDEGEISEERALSAAAPAPAQEARDGLVADAKGIGDGGGDAGPSVSIQAWNPDTPYLRRLDAAYKGSSMNEAQAREAYGIYLVERKQNQKAPGFYLDVGDWFERSGRADLAARVWSNLAELELENPNLLRVLAARLAQSGRLSEAKDIYGEVAVMRPEEPHSSRDLALTLSKMGQHGKAVDLLYKVALGDYPAWPEIELIALNELNGILPKADAAQQRHAAVDERLVKLLDDDIRITMSWDTDLSDMDLWVIEPSGEKAFYGHRETTIGGLVSRDITTGYGPEEYTLRKAMKGVYAIKANYYGNRNPEVSGTVTVSAEVITNWGRKDEKRRTLVLRLTGQSDVYQVGEIRF
jgi:Ca-activated chloride channel homolog